MTVNVLIVGERWCDAAPGGSLSNLNHNIIGSLETTGLASISTLFLDETVAAGMRSIRRSSTLSPPRRPTCCI